MTDKLDLDQLVYILLFLVLFPYGVAQLFFAHKIRDQLLRVRHYLERVYERHPILLKMFGPPLKTLTLKGYTVGRRIGGAILIIVAILCLISAFQQADPCESDYWSITMGTEPC